GRGPILAGQHQVRAGLRRRLAVAAYLFARCLFLCHASPASGLRRRNSTLAGPQEVEDTSCTASMTVDAETAPRGACAQESSCDPGRLGMNPMRDRRTTRIWLVRAASFRT